MSSGSGRTELDHQRSTGLDLETIEEHHGIAGVEREIATVLNYEAARADMEFVASPEGGH